MRKLIENEKYFQNLIAYNHNNPVHHNICEHPLNYPWSSYTACLSDKPTNLKRKEVSELFQDIQNFKYVHQLQTNDFPIDTFMGI